MGCTSTVKGEYMTPQMAIGFIAAMLEPDFRVRILDCLVERMDFATLYQILGSYADIKIIVISTAYPSLEGDLEVAQRCRQRFPGATLICWGAPFDYCSEEYFKQYPFIDVSPQQSQVIEEPVVELCRFLRERSFVLNKSDPALQGIAGLHLSMDGQTYTSPRRKYSGTYDYGRPAYHLMPPLKKYRHPIVRRPPFTVVNATRGCPMSCTFCAAKDHNFRTRSIEAIYDEISFVVRTQGVREVFFKDNFIDNRKGVLRLAEMMARDKLEVSWFTMARVGTLDLPYLRVMKSAGCRMLFIGVETLSDDMLTSVKKKVTVDNIFSAFRRCREAGIETMAHIIFGLPGETRESMALTTRMVKDLDPDYASFNVFVPYPGTDIYKEFEAQGFINTSVLSAYDQSGVPVYDLPGLPAVEIHAAMLRAYASFYDWRKKIQIARKARTLPELLGLARSAYLMYGKTLRSNLRLSRD